MAAHGLSIAKASFLAACLRPDVTKVSRDDLNTFYSLVETAISNCTPSTIQSTKIWLLEHVLPSSPRTIALAKYLASVAKYAVQPDAQERATRTCRRRLHILYLLNDILHHTKHHERNNAFRTNLERGLQPLLADLFHYAVEGHKKHTLKRLNDLLGIWKHEKYFQDQALLDTIQAALHSDRRDLVHTAVSVPKHYVTKEIPWILPATHGDTASPYFDLPAANLMPHIVPNSSTPMRTRQIQALQLSAGPADESLVNAVKDFLKDVTTVENPLQALEREDVVASMDDLGQISYQNEAGDLVGDTYYGWSRQFCDKMKSRGKEPPRGNDRGRSRSYGSDSDRSRSPHKRRRLSDSRSRSRSYSPSPPRRDIRQRLSRSRSRSQSYSPPRATFQHTTVGTTQPPLHPHPPPPPPPTSRFVQSNMPIPPPMFASNGVMLTPPKPPNWNGPWPPPPPPPPLNLAGNYGPAPFPSAAARGYNGNYNGHPSYSPGQDRR